MIRDLTSIGDNIYDKRSTCHVWLIVNDPSSGPPIEFKWHGRTFSHPHDLQSITGASGTLVKIYSHKILCMKCDSIHSLGISRVNLDIKMIVVLLVQSNNRCSIKETFMPVLIVDTLPNLSFEYTCYFRAFLVGIFSTH